MSVAPSGKSPALITFILIPNFSLIAFSSAIESLRLANLVAGQNHYQWDLVTLDVDAVPSSGGIPIRCSKKLEDVAATSCIFVCAGLDAHLVRNDRLSGWLRKRARGGTVIGALCTGAFLLARAGLLDGYRCTIHWASRVPLIEEFPNLNVTGNLYEMDRNRLICGGGTGVIDMILSLVALQHGRSLAAAVANHIGHERIRAKDEPQTIPLAVRLGVQGNRLLRALTAMEENIELPLTRSDVAQAAKLSTRQVERLFRRHVGESPKRYYRQVRLQHARRLLAQSSLSVTEVAVACGFSSLSHFSKSYREAFGHAPGRDKGAHALS